LRALRDEEWPVAAFCPILPFVFSTSRIFKNMARLAFSFVPVRFFHGYVFSTTSLLRFPVRSGSFLGVDPVFSITSPVRFSK